MTVPRLSLVSEALMRLVETHATSSPEWPAATVLTVTPEPPDRLAGDHTIGLYLHHTAAEPHYTNPPPTGTDPVPVATQPLALRLHYLLTARSDLAGGDGPLEEQFLLGLALKALHDHPLLIDTSTVAGTTVFGAALRDRGNRFRVEIEPVPAEEAIQYWTAGTQPLRLSAYVVVHPVLLEPEPITGTAGRVVAYGVHSFTRGAPRLDHTANRIEVTLPDTATHRTIDLRPAEVAVGGGFALTGTDLAGDAVALLVQHADWSDPVEVDATAWGVAALPTAVTATVQATVATPDGPRAVLPGVYRGQVRVATDGRMPDGTTRRFTSLSNAAPFLVVPRVDAVAWAAGIATVTGAGFDPAASPDDAIAVYLGSDRLERVDAGTPAGGQFRPDSDSQLRLRPPAGTPSGTLLPLRIVVRGAENAPRWETAP